METISLASNAILAVNSLNRYTTNNSGRQNQPLGNALQQQYYLSATPGDPFDNGFTAGPPCNNFTITSPGAILYGYISRIVVSQVQLNYNIPTIVPEMNDSFWIIQGNVLNPISAYVTIPFGFYTPDELAAVLQILIRQTDFGQPQYAPDFTVSYFSSTQSSTEGFQFASNNVGFSFYFPSLAQINAVIFPDNNIPSTDLRWINSLKIYRTLGISSINAATFDPGTLTYDGLDIQVSSTNVNLLYTPYIDIISETLTKYQTVKDTDTSAQKLNSIIARIYLTGQTLQFLTDGANTPEILGARPFTVLQDLNNPKVIRWSKDEAVNSLDFQLRDQYGDLIFTSIINPNTLRANYFFTEFQMTLLCIEGYN